jgi:hypothetical protein
MSGTRGSKCVLKRNYDSSREVKWKQNENSPNYKNQENMKQAQLGMPDKKK